MSNDKELIERMALEVDSSNPRIDPQDRDYELIRRYLAERGKEAVAWRAPLEFEDGSTEWKFSIVPGLLRLGEPLFLAPQPAIPEGMALVPIGIHPLDGTERNGVAALLCNPPEVLRDQDPTDYYAYWWGLLVAAAGASHEPR